jgi:chorismate mutase-like protein
MTLDEALRMLDEYRGEIDKIDREILILLNARTMVVEKIGEVKRAMNMPVYEPRREEEVYQNVTSHNHGPLPADAVKRVFERIIDEMRTIQRERMRRANQQSQAGVSGERSE